VAETGRKKVWKGFWETWNNWDGYKDRMDIKTCQIDSRYGAHRERFPGAQRHGVWTTRRDAQMGGD
jgi:hypothetical protein